LFVMRIRMIRVFIRYAYSYDTRIRMIRVFDWYAYHTRIVCQDIRERYCIFYFLRSFLFLLEKWVQWGQIQWSHSVLRTQEMAFPGSKFQKFPGRACPRTTLAIQVFQYATVRYLARSAPAIDYTNACVIKHVVLLVCLLFGLSVLGCFITKINLLDRVVFLLHNNT
jgi:hypothetical protein